MRQIDCCGNAPVFEAQVRWLVMTMVCATAVQGGGQRECHALIMARIGYWAVCGCWVRCLMVLMPACKGCELAIDIH